MLQCILIAEVEAPIPNDVAAVAIDKLCLYLDLGTLILQ